MRVHALRDVLDTIFHILKSGCPWRLLPGDFLPWQTVFCHFRQFRISGLWHRIFKTLHTKELVRTGRNPSASAAIMDVQSVKTVEESALISGYDAHKNVKGCKRHLLVYTLGLPLSICVTLANVQDRLGARCLLSGMKTLVTRLKKIWAGGAYTGDPLHEWRQNEGGWELEVVVRDRESSGFQVAAKRWIVERTFGWLGMSRRLAKDYERKIQTRETLTEVAMIRMMLGRLAGAKLTR